MHGPRISLAALTGAFLSGTDGFAAVKPHICESLSAHRRALPVMVRRDEEDLGLRLSSWRDTPLSWDEDGDWDDEGDWREGLDFNPDEDAAIDTAKYYVGFFASVAFFDFISPLASEP